MAFVVTRRQLLRGRLATRVAACGVAAAALVISLSVMLRAQVPGQNINIVSKDPHLAKQNEPSGAMSTVNPCHVLMGANDYRTVYLQGTNDDREVRDAWVGVYQSTDCGQTWLAGLMPGYPQDATAEGVASPAHEFTAAADPVVRAGLGGFFAYSYIVFDRGNNPGKLLLSRFIDPNNTQVNVASVTSADPIQIPTSKWPMPYVGPTLVVEGNAGQFLDKPDMEVSPGTGTCTLSYRDPGGNLVTRTIPATVVHLVWTTFLNNAGEDGKVLTRVNYNRSSNCGQSLDGPTRKLSETYLVNQGASVSISPVNPNEIFVTWRNFTTDFATSQLLFSRSVDGGQSFTPPAPVPSFTNAAFFDQATVTAADTNPAPPNPPAFRTIAYPTTTFDHNGKLYLAVSLRTTDNASRVFYTSYTTNPATGAITWQPAPLPVAPSTTAEHQIMPALAYAAGKLQIVWYDFKDDASGVDTRAIDDSHVFTAAGPSIRHTVDVRGAQGDFDPQGNVTFATYGAVQIPGQTPKISQYLIGTDNSDPTRTVKPLQSNRPNLKLYCGGECAFIGDYIDVNGVQWVPQIPATPPPPNTPTTWVFNSPSVASGYSQEFHAVWTDNRDAIIDSVFPDSPGGIVSYSSVAGGGCTPATQAFTKTRNANVYTARITPGISLLVPVNAKPVDTTVTQRSFPFTILNGTPSPQIVTVTIANQPAGGGRASFVQSLLVPNTTTISVVIPARSSAARTLYVSSTTMAFAPVRIEATAGPTLNSSVVINPDSTNPLPSGAFAAGETHEPSIANPDMDNPDLDNPDLDNPDLDNPDLDNPDLDNPDLDNPDLDNPDLDNPDLDNPDLDNASLVSGAVWDTTYEITNAGNDAGVFQIDLDISGKKTDPYHFQLFARRVYKLPSANGCTQTKVGQNQIAFNIANPDTTVNAFPDANSAAATNGTVLLMPGETIKLTLRVRPKDAKTPKFCPFADTDGGCTAKTKTHTVTVKVKAHAANSNETTPKQTSFTKQ